MEVFIFAPLKYSEDTMRFDMKATHYILTSKLYHYNRTMQKENHYHIAHLEMILRLGTLVAGVQLRLLVTLQALNMCCWAALCETDESYNAKRYAVRTVDCKIEMVTAVRSRKSKEREMRPSEDDTQALLGTSK